MEGARRSADGTIRSVARPPYASFAGDAQLNAVVTIVLPVHNAQRTLRSTLLGMMELAETTGRRLQVAVVDDGSTDATYEIACDLASEFPQLSILRQPYQRGLGAALELVRHRLGAGDVIAHSGVGAVDHQELAALLARSERCDAPHLLASSAAADARGSRRAAAGPTLSARLADAHRAGGAFRWLRIDEPAAPRRKRSATPVLSAALDGLMPSIGFSSSANGVK
jgi:hypothetical protein